MNAKIITYHFVNNFGGALQAYALSKAIEENIECPVEIVDYRHWFIRFTDAVRLLPITKTPGEITSGIRTMTPRLGRLGKFKKFQKDDFKMTRTYSTYNGLKSMDQKGVKYIAGSDQVWNPIVTMGVAQSYLLNFVKDSNNKISYAASFGVSNIPEKHQVKMGKLLSDFSAISVRENEGISLVKDMANRDAVQVIDPTFLLTKEHWDEFAIEPQQREQYILIYTMQNNPTVYKYAKQIKDILGIKVIDLSRYGYKNEGVDEVIINAGPREFVGLFKNAAFVCTNSFHGLAFSAILEKKFFMVPSNRFNARIDSLMKVLGMELPKEVTKENVLNRTYDVEDLRERIAKEKSISLEYLKNNLK